MYLHLFFVSLMCYNITEVAKMAIGEQIKQLRKQQHLTQKQLSEKSGIAEITIRQYEADRYNPKIEALKRLATALNCEVSDIDESLTINKKLYNNFRLLCRFASMAELAVFTGFSAISTSSITSLIVTFSYVFLLSKVVHYVVH